MSPSTTEQPRTEAQPTADERSDWRADKDPRLLPYGDTNLGTPPDLLDHRITPTDVFFVRTNYPIPEVDPISFRLRVQGLVNRPLELSLADLQEMPHRSVTAVIECAGNSRTRFRPSVDGTPWREDAVGNAEWTGVSLAHVLDLAELHPDAVDVVSQGGDDPRMQRGLPVRAALDPDTLLAWQMNGEPLRRAHGAPLRLMVPGWGGIASTKWLVGLDVVGVRFDGYWNAHKYVMVDPSGEAVGRVEEMPVKSSIMQPPEDAVLAPGPVRLAGFAWSGRGEVRRVEVSVDGGATYVDATSIDRTGARGWLRWTYDWAAGPGTYEVSVRATDATGDVQPITTSWNVQGYQMNQIPVRTVVVRPS